MKIFATTIIIEVDDKFCDRKPDDGMIERYLKSRIGQGSVNEGNMRGKVIMNIKNVRLRTIEIY